MDKSNENELHNTRNRNPKGQLSAINCMAINVNSLQHNVRRLELHRRIEQYQPDIVLISETKLTPKHYILSKSYDIIRTDHPNAKQGGGTAIMINNNICYQIIKYPTSLNNELLEFTIIQLLPEPPNLSKTFIISCYATNSNRKIFIHELDDLLQRLNASHPNHFFILAGDLNARRIEWGDKTDNQRGKYLRKWEAESANNYTAKIFPTDEPSFAPAQTFLDVCITNLQIINLKDGDKIATTEYDSDHRALLFTIMLPANNSLDNNAAPIRRNLKAIKWKKFEKAANREYSQDLREDKNLTSDEIDETIAEITKVLVAAINKSAPEIKKVDSILKYVNSKIKTLQKNKSKTIGLLRAAQKSRSPNQHEQITSLKTTLSLIKAELRTEINKSVDSYWRGQLKQINHKDPTAFFPKTNRLLTTTTT